MTTIKTDRNFEKIGKILIKESIIQNGIAKRIINGKLKELRNNLIHEYHVDINSMEYIFTEISFRSQFNRVFKLWLNQKGIDKLKIQKDEKFIEGLVNQQSLHYHIFASALNKKSHGNQIIPTDKQYKSYMEILYNWIFGTTLTKAIESFIEDHNLEESEYDKYFSNIRKFRINHRHGIYNKFKDEINRDKQFEKLIQIINLK